jgi:uncharacterized protein
MANATEPGRIVTLDIIRGVAVMGIFSVNVVAFAMIEGAYLNPPAYGGHDGIDLAMWIANMVVIDGKMRSLFSMLFGASMLLVIQRAEANGEVGFAVHVRRMLVLFVIGLVHFHIWYGDILHLYAAVGLIAYLFRKLPAEKLLVWGGLLIAINMAMFGAIVAQIVGDDIAAHAPAAGPSAIASWNEFAGSFYPTAQTLAKDMAIYRGGMVDVARHWIVDEPFSWAKDILFFTPETLGLMLIGMAGYKSGFLTGGWDDSIYRKIAWIGLTIGALASLAVVAVDIGTRFYVPTVFGAFLIGLAPFRPVMAAGYAALIILLTRKGGWLSRRLAAVGRAAFTNYLGTSLIATFIFYGWGLGLYGTVSRAESWLLVPLVWLLMLAWSKPWLERFQYGPLEWLWRTIARGRFQPMRKPRTNGQAPAAV